MLDPLNITIDGLDFQYMPLSPVEVLKLDKTLLGLLAPALAGMSKKDGKLDIDLSVSAPALGNLLIQLPDEQFMAFATRLLGRTTCITGGTNLMSSAAAFNKVFAESSVVTIYKVLFEALKYNKFSFFELAASGAAMLKTLGLSEQTPKTEGTGEQSGSSET